MSRDMKFTATLNDQVSKKLDALATKAREAMSQYQAIGAGQVQNAAKLTTSLTSEEKKREATLLRIQKQAAIAEASLVLDRFDRRIAVEKVKHRQILEGLEKNHAAREAETRRHMATVSRIQMDQANFANTPFQKMLQNFNALNAKIGAVGPAVGGLSAQFQGVGNAAGAMGMALSSVSAGPVGVAVASVSVLTLGLTSLMQRAKEVAQLREGMRSKLGPKVDDSTLGMLEKLGPIMERYDKALEKAKANQAAFQKGAGGGFGAYTSTAMAVAGTGMAEVAKLQAEFKSLTKGISIEQWREDHGRDVQAVIDRLRSGADEMKDIEHRLASARIEALQDETAKKIAHQQLAFENEKQELRAKHLSTQKLEEWNQQVLANIRAEAAREEAALAKRLETENKDRGTKFLAESTALRAKLLAQAKAGREEEVREARQAQQARYKAMTFSVGAIPDEGVQKLAALKAEKENEIAVFRLSDEARILGKEATEKAVLDIETKYKHLREQLEQEQTEKRKRLAAEERDKRIAAMAGMFSGFASLAAQANMKDRQARLRWKALAIAEATANTALAISKANAAAPWPFSIALMAGAAAAGAAQVITIKNQKFERGGIVRGPRHASGGVPAELEGGEVVWSRADVARHGGTAAVDRMRGGGFAHHGAVNFVFNIQGKISEMEAKDIGKSVATSYHQRLRDLAKMQRDVEYYGYR